MKDLPEFKGGTPKLERCFSMAESNDYSTCQKSLFGQKPPNPGCKKSAERGKGDSHDFHKACDGKGPTVSVFKTVKTGGGCGKGGCIFGGIADKCWSTEQYPFNSACASNYTREYPNGKCPSDAFHPSVDQCHSQGSTKQLIGMSKHASLFCLKCYGASVGTKPHQMKLIPDKITCDPGYGPGTGKKCRGGGGQSGKSTFGAIVSDICKFRKSCCVAKAELC